MTIISNTINLIQIQKIIKNQCTKQRKISTPILSLANGMIK